MVIGTQDELRGTGHGIPPERSVGAHMVAEAVTETQELQAVTDALSLIDSGLSDMLHRELVSTDEVANLLLDLRMLLAPLTTAALEDTDLLAPN
jgi:hypothetical protein